MEDREAVGRKEFVQVQKYDDIFDRLNNENVIVNTQILIGRSGVGKTELALQVVKRFKTQRGNGNHLLSARFNSDSITNLGDSLSVFADKNGLEIPSLRNSYENLDEAFGEFFKEVNRCYQGHLKCFIFDDAELVTSVVKCIDNQICRPLEEAHNAEQRKNWKILVTTQVDERNGWLTRCECLSPLNFITILGFNEDNVSEFFRPHGVSLLNDDSVRDVILELGGAPMLPLMLKVLRAEIQANVETELIEIRQFLRTYFDRINRLTGLMPGFTDDRILAALHVSLRRLVEQSSHSREYEQMIGMLTMYDGRNFTSDMLFSCAEVVLSANADDEGDHSAYDLTQKFVHDMMKRFLCDKLKPKLYGLHKLIKASMMLFRRPQELGKDRDIARNALLALTRVIPKDGRGHQSHNVFGFMYSHGKALADEIEILRQEGVVDRDRTPCVMLMYCNLLTGMGYCQLARRNPIHLAVSHLMAALDVFSLLVANRSHEELARNQTMEAVAETLFSESVRSSLLNDPFYSNTLVRNIIRYYRVTPKDLKHLMETDDELLLNGHLNDAQLRKLQRDRKLLDPQLYLHRYYPIELLAELYSVWAKSNQLQQDDQWSDACFEYGKAALALYSQIQREQRILLLGEVITRRELLKIRLMRQEPLDHIERGWHELKKVNGKAFEYGLMRTNFFKDNYHRYLCDEGLADCIGEAYKRNPNEATYLAGDHHFEQLIVRSKEEKLNMQTTSKTHRHHAEFRLRCGRQRQAIRAVIDSMMYLHEFLVTTDLSTPFPEQQETCGKFKPLLELLTKCYNHGQDDRKLRSDGEDAQRLEYLKRFVEHWTKEDECGQAGGSDRFRVMQDLLDASGYDSDEGVMAEGPVQAMAEG